MLKISDLRNNPDWIDYSSLSMFTSCPRKYYWRIVRAVTSSVESAALINGEAYHEAKATYLKLKSTAGHEAAKEAGLKALIPIMKRIPADANAKHSVQVAIATMNSYFEHWRDEIYEVIAVEIEGAVDLKNFMYAFRIDAIKRHPAFGLLVEETKSTSIVGDRWAMRGKPNLQIDGYVSSYFIGTGEMPQGAILDIIPVSAKVDKKPLRFITMREEKDVEDWLDTVQEWWFLVKRCKERNYFPMNTEECTPLVGFSCGFNTLCQLYPHPHKIENLSIPEEYKIEKWAPFDELKEVKNVG